MAKVKICGITNVADARAAVEAGADAFGLIFAASPRCVSAQQARDIVGAAGSGACVPVGVFVDEPVARIVEIAAFAGLRCLQLHGNEQPQVVGQLLSRGYDVVKSFRVAPSADVIAMLQPYPATAYLLDTFVPGQAGGTGRTFDWSLARAAAPGMRVIVSGGLGVDNVLDAIRLSQPYGVDASSRLELKPGVKDPDKVREFIRLVKSASPAAVSVTRWPR